MEVDFSTVELKPFKLQGYKFVEFELHLSFGNHVPGFIFRADEGEYRKNLVDIYLVVRDGG
jgi:hypothetical protein